MVKMADQAGMRALHMFTTGDPARNGTFVLFADADYFLTDFPSSTCETCINSAFAWNHGDITILMLLGLQDGYVHDGRAVVEALEPWAIPHELREHPFSLFLLSQTYKQLNAPFGSFAKDLLTASTKALSSGSPTDDGRYSKIESGITSLTGQRDALAGQIKTSLDTASFNGGDFDEQGAARLTQRAFELLVRAAALAGAP